MAIAPYWETADGSWDQLGLGEHVPLPGVWTISGSAARDIDVKPRPGQDTAKIKNKGYRNAQLSLVGRLHGAEQLAALEVVLESIHPRKKGNADEALRILNPRTTLLGVKFVLVERIHTADLDDDGILTQRIDVIEYVRKPRNKKGGKPAIKQKDSLVLPEFLSFKPPIELPPSDTALGFIDLSSLP